MCVIPLLTESNLEPTELPGSTDEKKNRKIITLVN